MNIEENEKQIKSQLLSTKRPFMKGLISYMEEQGFFTSPCSGGNHLACEGGLAEHSINVYRLMNADAACKLEPKEYDELHNSIVVCSLLHDLGKMGAFNKQNYVPNMVDSRKKDSDGNKILKQSDAKPFVTNSQLLYIPHEVRSIVIAEMFIDLTEEEEHAIYYHNGKYTHIGYDLKETPLYLLLHSADMWASRVVETKTDSECGLPFVTVPNKESEE